MKTIVYLSFLLLLSSCLSDDDGFTKDVNFTITNSLNEDVEGEVFTTNGSRYAIQKRDSINFEIKSGEEKSIHWNRPDMGGGEGEFILFIDEELNRNFGYFTNGVSLEGSFTITIEPDTIIIQ